LPPSPSWAAPVCCPARCTRKPSGRRSAPERTCSARSRRKISGSARQPCSAWRPSSWPDGRWPRDEPQPPRGLVSCAASSGFSIQQAMPSPHRTSVCWIPCSSGHFMCCARHCAMPAWPRAPGRQHSIWPTWAMRRPPMPRWPSAPGWKPSCTNPGRATPPIGPGCPRSHPPIVSAAVMPPISPQRRWGWVKASRWMPPAPPRSTPLARPARRCSRAVPI